MGLFAIFQAINIVDVVTGILQTVRGQFSASQQVGDGEQQQRAYYVQDYGRGSGGKRSRRTDYVRAPVDGEDYESRADFSGESHRMDLLPGQGQGPPGYAGQGYENYRS